MVRRSWWLLSRLLLLLLRVRGSQGGDGGFARWGWSPLFFFVGGRGVEERAKGVSEWLCLVFYSLMGGGIVKRLCM